MTKCFTLISLVHLHQIYCLLPEKWGDTLTDKTGAYLYEHIGMLTNQSDCSGKIDYTSQRACRFLGAKANATVADNVINTYNY